MPYSWQSPWPITGSIGTMSLASGLIMWFFTKKKLLIMMSMMIIMMTMIQWWRDTVRESTFQGMHTSKVEKSMKIGMMLFITSEVMFFSSFFWSFFHSSLSPNMEIGMQWPPMGIKTFNPMNIPMLNTMILLSSGMSMTWAHNSLVKNKITQLKKSMLITIVLGMYFSILQAYEYKVSTFCMSDSIYGATFFLSTGFHGIHVMIGTMFILVTFVRTSMLHFSSKHHVGFEASAWYWHFVDVVWLFLYISI